MASSSNEMPQLSGPIGSLQIVGIATPPASGSVTPSGQPDTTLWQMVPLDSVVTKATGAAPCAQKVVTREKKRLVLRSVVKDNETFELVESEVEEEEKPIMKNWPDVIKTCDRIFHEEVHCSAEQCDHVGVCMSTGSSGGPWCAACWHQDMEQKYGPDKVYYMCDRKAEELLEKYTEMGMTKQPQPKQPQPKQSEITVSKPCAEALIKLRKEWNSLRQQLGAWHKIQGCNKTCAQWSWFRFVRWKLMQKEYSDKGNLLKLLKQERKEEGLKDPSNVKPPPIRRGQKKSKKATQTS